MTRKIFYLCFHILFLTSLNVLECTHLNIFYLNNTESSFLEVQHPGIYLLLPGLVLYFTCIIGIIGF